MKSGCDITILPRKRDANSVCAHLREWASNELNDPHAPDAYAAVTLRFEPETPGRPSYNVAFCSEHDAIPHALLTKLAAAIIEREGPVFVAECRIMERLGVETWWDPPDDSA